MPTSIAKAVIDFISDYYQPTDGIAMLSINIILYELNDIQVLSQEACLDSDLSRFMGTGIPMHLLSTIFNAELSELHCPEEVKTHLSGVFNILWTRLAASA